MNFNTETTVHDNMDSVKYKQHDTLYEPVLFATLKQIQVSHAMFKVTSFDDFGQYLKSFSYLEWYVR